MRCLATSDHKCRDNLRFIVTFVHTWREHLMCLHHFWSHMLRTPKVDCYLWSHMFRPPNVVCYVGHTCQGNLRFRATCAQKCKENLWLFVVIVGHKCQEHLRFIATFVHTCQEHYHKCKQHLRCIVLITNAKTSNALLIHVTIHVKTLNVYCYLCLPASCLASWRAREGGGDFEFLVMFLYLIKICVVYIKQINITTFPLAHQLAGHWLDSWPASWPASQLASRPAGQLASQPAA